MHFISLQHAAFDILVNMPSSFHVTEELVLHGLGCGRPGQDPSFVASLLPRCLGGEITEDHWLCLCLKMEVSEQGQSFFFLSTFLVRICRFHHVAAAAAAAAAGFAVVLLLQKFLQHTVLNVPLFNSVFVKSNMFDCNGSASKKHLRHQWTDLCRRQQRS